MELTVRFRTPLAFTPVTGAEGEEILFSSKTKESNRDGILLATFGLYISRNSKHTAITKMEQFMSKFIQSQAYNPIKGKAVK